MNTRVLRSARFPGRWIDAVDIMQRMPHIPDQSDPVAYLPWRCEMSVRVGQILVAVVDDSVRAVLLRNTARRLGAPYIVCRPLKSPRQFLEFLAEGLDFRAPRNRHDLWDNLKERLHREPRLVVLDSAELLTRTSLKIILDFHKMEEHRHRQVAFVLASGDQRLLKLVDAIDRDGSFIRHCAYYIPGCQPTKKMREDAEALRAALAPPTVPFSAIVSGTAGDYLHPDGD